MNETKAWLKSTTKKAFTTRSRQRKQEQMFCDEIKKKPLTLTKRGNEFNSLIDSITNKYTTKKSKHSSKKKKRTEELSDADFDRIQKEMLERNKK